MVCVCREGIEQCSWWITRDFNGQLKSYCANPNVPFQAKIICDGTQPQFISKWEAGTIKVVTHGDGETLEKQGKSPMPVVLKEPEAVNEKNVVGMSEINRRKPISAVVEPIESSKPDAAPGQTAVSYRNTPVSENQKISHRTAALKGPEVTEPKIPSVGARQNESPQSDIIKELETNLAIATIPWSDQLLSFQTICWDAKHGEGEPLLTAHTQELLQLYIDIGLANNIVWLATEIGHRSQELDVSYIKLCNSVAVRIKKIMSLVGGTI